MLRIRRARFQAVREACFAMAAMEEKLLVPWLRGDDDGGAGSLSMPAEI